VLAAIKVFISKGKGSYNYAGPFAEETAISLRIRLGWGDAYKGYSKG
jgi:hypothetical protein